MSSYARKVDHLIERDQANAEHGRTSLTPCDWLSEQHSTDISSSFGKESSERNAERCVVRMHKVRIVFFLIYFF